MQACSLVQELRGMQMKIAEGRKNETSRRDELDAMVVFVGKEGTGTLC
jgi:hypothetical protein